jgi:hypothetical protein
MHQVPVSDDVGGTVCPLFTADTQHVLDEWPKGRTLAMRCVCLLEVIVNAYYMFIAIFPIICA